MRPVLVTPLPPAKPITSPTAGSSFTMRTYCSIFCFIAGKEMSCEAWIMPMMRPVSCWGKKPLGTMMYR